MILSEAPVTLGGENEPRFYSVPVGEYFFWQHDPYLKISPDLAVNVMCSNHGVLTWKRGGTITRIDTEPIHFAGDKRVRNLDKRTLNGYLSMYPRGGLK